MSTDRERSRVLRQMVAPGLALAGVALFAVVVMGGIDALRSDRYHSLAALLTPDPVAAAWTMALLGTAEGVAIAIAITTRDIGRRAVLTRTSSWRTSSCASSTPTSGRR